MEAFTWDLFFRYLYLINAVIVFLFILLDERKPEEVLAWLLVLFFVPLFGILFYIFFGINWKKRRLLKQDPADLFREGLSGLISRQKDYFQHQIESGQSETRNDRDKLIRLLLESNKTILTLRNDIRLYHDGGTKFSDLLNDLEQATHSIHMEYYIWRSDELGCRIKDILVNKARAGVEVRLLFDGVGSFGTISRRYRQELARAGVQFGYFLGLKGLGAVFKINYCNHRKIVVIDGLTGYTGGMNVGEEYIDGGRRFKAWRDTHLRIRGESAQLLQAIFLVDWSNSRKDEDLLLGKAYFPQIDESQPIRQVQIACSGPDSDWSSVRLLYFSLISNANQQVRIQTPYFNPDSSLMNALLSAAPSGVDVRLMMAGLPDKRLPFWVAHTYYEPLLKAGVRIFQYRGGFFHGKTVVVDGQAASVGTCNMDVRSFNINYEVNTVIYSEQTASELLDRFRTDRLHCREITGGGKAQERLCAALRPAAVE